MQEIQQGWRKTLGQKYTSVIGKMLQNVSAAAEAMTRTIRKTTSLPLAIIGGIADHAHDF